jgi:hypothetical protein
MINTKAAMAKALKKKQFQESSLGSLIFLLQVQSPTITEL